MTEKRTWVVTHDSHQLKKGDTFTGEALPLWLVGKVQEVPASVFEVATPAKAKRSKKEAD